MKKCTYCGKEYATEALVCAADGEPLIDPTVAKAPRVGSPKVSKLSYAITLPIVLAIHVRLLSSGPFVDVIASPASIVLAVVEVLCIGRLLGSNDQS